jgi:hypothetical protein
MFNEFSEIVFFCCDVRCSRLRESGNGGAELRASHFG